MEFGCDDMDEDDDEDGLDDVERFVINEPKRRQGLGNPKTRLSAFKRVLVLPNTCMRLGASKRVWTRNELGA
eukprot:scaffold3563_cov138-Alexandrium_tamarense.AAC.2